MVTAVAAASLALGIGANAAIFSVVDQLLLRPLPVRAPARLVNLTAPGDKSGSTSCGPAGTCDAVFSYPMFRDLECAPGPRTAVEGVAAHVAFAANLAADAPAGAARARTAQGELVSGAYFPLLGVAPALGRLLGPQDDPAGGAAAAPPVAVLSHDYWTRELGADPSVVGRTVLVNAHPLTVVGVAPRGFAGTTRGLRPDLFVPIALRGVLVPGDPGFENRQSYWAYLFARLRPGATADDARRQLDAVFRRALLDVEAAQQTDKAPGYQARFQARHLLVAPGARGQSQLHEMGATPAALLFAVTGLVLLIACANVANLLLARGAARAGEMAVRMSLGAGRRRLVGQLLAESCTLALVGAAGGLLVARWTLAGLVSLLPPEADGVVAVALDWRVAAFAALVALAAGVAAGLFPALQSTRPDLVAAVRASAGQIAGGSRAAARFRAGLVGAQIATSMLLLACAGLALRSLANVLRADLGLRVDHVVTFSVAPERGGYGGARAARLYERLERELAALPGATGAAAARVPVLAGSNYSTDVLVQGDRRGPKADVNTSVNIVSPDYFRLLGIPVLAGRAFTGADRLGAPKVAVVNEAFARKFGLGRGAVGRRVGDADGKVLDVEIVGVVRDAKYRNAKNPVPPVYFTPARQDTTLGRLTFYVRTARAPEAALRDVAAVVRRVDPTLPVEGLMTMPAQVREGMVVDRTIGLVAGAFAGLATVLAAVGLYGVLAYTVAQRTRELGVRVALGASARAVAALVYGQVGRLVLAGVLAGLAGALAVGHAAQALLYGVTGADAVAFGAAAAVLAAVGLGAGYVPARRATRVDPMRALRAE